MEWIPAAGTRFDVYLKLPVAFGQMPFVNLFGTLFLRPSKALPLGLLPISSY